MNLDSKLGVKMHITKKRKYKLEITQLENWEKCLIPDKVEHWDVLWNRLQYKFVPERIQSNNQGSRDMFSLRQFLLPRCQTLQKYLDQNYTSLKSN